MAKGGKREGAGRKPAHEAGPAVLLACRIDPDLHAEVLAFAKAHGLGTPLLVSTALRTYLDAHRDSKHSEQ